jgi:hypothetical protein
MRADDGDSNLPMVAVVLRRAPASGIDGEQVEELQGAGGK